MSVARRNQHMAAQHRIAVLGLLDLDIAETVQAFCKCGGKFFRHMLNDHDAG
ncbi:hypothetical protein D3C72_2286040 [compost metagenome]